MGIPSGEKMAREYKDLKQEKSFAARIGIKQNLNRIGNDCKKEKK